MAIQNFPRGAAYAALACVGLLHASVYPSLFGASYSAVAIGAFVAPTALATALAFVRSRLTTGHDRTGWLLLTLSLATTFTLDTIWCLATRWGHPPGYPGWFDPFYLASYVSYIVSIGMLTSPMWRDRDRRWLSDAGAFLAIAAGLGWHFVFPRASDGTTESLVSFSYLMLDLAFLATVLSAIYRARLTFRNCLLLLAATTLATGDILYYFHPMAFDSTWTVGIWLMAIAAVTPSELTLRFAPLRFARSHYVPYFVVAFLVPLTIYEMPRGRADDLLLAGIVALGFVVARQIVSLRQALATQRHETAFREAVLETQSDLGLAMLILEDNRVVFANGAAERITGLSIEQLKTLPAIDVLAFDSERMAWDDWLSDPAVPEDTRIARPDGVVVEIEVVARRLRSPGERRLLLVARDVTVRKQAEQALAQAQKLEGLGALAGGVAHDFNNLLSAVIGNVGLLQMGELDDEARETIRSIDVAARRGADLTRSLLDFARVQPQQFRVEDLGACLAETVSLARAALPVNVSLTFEGEAVASPVRANRGQLVQAFLNLIINARDAVGERGEVSVRLSQDDGMACVEVTDDGAGMDEATQRRIFEPFFTTKTAGAGTGLGLAISQRTFRDHRGTVEVQSREGFGTTFTIRLPLSVIARAS